MDCQQVKDLLSSYYDGELSPEVNAVVAQHLAGCHDCTAELAGFGELSATAQSLRHPVPPKHIWDGLQSQLHTRPIDDATIQLSRGWLTWMKRPAARFAFAAAALVLIAIGWLGYTMSSHQDEHQMAAVFGQYLDQFQSDPHSAQDILLANYQNRALTADQAIHTVGYRPVVAEGLPPAYSLVSTHVMKMPCCTCVQCLCRRDDGTVIAIFEHDDEETDWFAEFPNFEAICNGTRCTLVRLDKGIAASWRQGNRYITLVGVDDKEEVERLVAWFDKRRRILPR